MMMSQYGKMSRREELTILGDAPFDDIREDPLGSDDFVYSLVSILLNHPK